MRSSIYNRYWSTGGGAEKFGGVIAEVLARRGPVELLTHDPFDLDWLAERLRLDLSGCTVRVIEQSHRSVAKAAVDTDLFVNVCFMSHDVAPHERSLYVVHFPAALDGHLPRWQRSLARRSNWIRKHALPVSFEWGTGFYPREGGRRAMAWTDGEATISLITDPGRPVPVTLAFGFARPPGAGPAALEVLVDGDVVAVDDLEGPRSSTERFFGRGLSFPVASSEPDIPVEVTIRSSTFVPAELGAGDDVRTLGVPLSGIQIGDGAAGMVARAVPGLLSQPVSSRWVTTYGKVVSNSAFTQGWVERRWGIESDVLFPPITLHERGTKDNVIAHVGRFFPAHLGHSKKQLELVQAFRSLVDEGVADWELHLVGGCSVDGQGYLEEVEAAAAGYPVRFHVNATGTELSALLARASIYWHASGYGVDPDKEPDVLEHFGISTVEAMSAGAVPLVLAAGGLVETVRHGRDGYHFRTLDGLVAMTRRLVDDPALLAHMSESAEARAHDFGIEAFTARLDAIVDDLLAPEGPIG
jgi:glycosyltransferase involved in cell wall biosynthesis